MSFLRTLVEGKKRLFWLLAGGTVLLDQLTKLLLAHAPGDGRPPIVLIPHVLQLVSHGGNPRGIFGRGPESLAFYIVAALVGLAVVALFFFTTAAHKGLVYAALGLLAGGAVGNLIDRACSGVVRDFIDLHWKEAFHWYTFNVADAAICAGFGLVVYDLIFARVEERAGAEGGAGEGDGA